MRTLLIASSLLYASIGYAADCSVSFDQSCLSGDYDAQEIEENYSSREQEMDAHFKAVEKEEEIQSKIEEKAWQEEEKERRHQERLTVEEQKARAESRQGRALEEISRQLQLQNFQDAVRGR